MYVHFPDLTLKIPLLSPFDLSLMVSRKKPKTIHLFSSIKMAFYKLPLCDINI